MQLMNEWCNGCPYRLASASIYIIFLRLASIFGIFSRHSDVIYRQRLIRKFLHYAVFELRLVLSNFIRNVLWLDVFIHWEVICKKDQVYCIQYAVTSSLLHITSPFFHSRCGWLIIVANIKTKIHFCKLHPKTKKDFIDAILTLSVIRSKRGSC